MLKIKNIGSHTAGQHVKVVITAKYITGKAKPQSFDNIVASNEIRLI